MRFLFIASIIFAVGCSSDAPSSDNGGNNGWEFNNSNNSNNTNNVANNSNNSNNSNNASNNGNNVNNSNNSNNSNNANNSNNSNNTNNNGNVGENGMCGLNSDCIAGLSCCPDGFQGDGSCQTGCQFGGGFCGDNDAECDGAAGETCCEIQGTGICTTQMCPGMNNGNSDCATNADCATAGEFCCPGQGGGTCGTADECQVPGNGLCETANECEGNDTCCDLFVANVCFDTCPI